MRTIHACILIAFTLCASCAELANQRILELERMGWLEEAYEFAQDASTEYPDNTPIEAHRDRLGDALVGRVIAEANRLNESDLVGRISVLESALAYEAPRNAEARVTLERLHSKLELVRAQAETAISSSDAIQRVSGFYGLRFYHPYVDEVSALRAELAESEAKLETDLRILIEKRDLGRAVAAAYVAHRVLPESAALVQVYRATLEASAAEVRRVWREAGGRDAPPWRRLAYASAAEMYAQEPETAAETISRAIRDAASEGLPRTHVECDGMPQELEAQLRQEFERACEWQVVVDEPRHDPRSLWIECQVSLVDLGLARSESPEVVYSRFRSGTRSEPNPEYDRRAVEYAQATSSANQAGLQNALSPNIGSAFASGFAKGRAARLSRELAATPRFLQVPNYIDYSFTATTHVLTPIVRLEYEFIACHSGAVLAQGEWVFDLETEVIHAPDVHPDDAKGWNKSIVDAELVAAVLQRARTDAASGFALRMSEVVDDCHQVLVRLLAEEGHRELAEGVSAVSGMLGELRRSCDDEGGSHELQCLGLARLEDRLDRRFDSRREVDLDALIDECRLGATFDLVVPASVRGWDPHRRVTELALEADEPRCRLLVLDSESNASEPMSARGPIDELLDSTVVIRTDASCGSGFVVGHDLLVTNYHVVDGASVIEVLYGGARRDAEVVDVRIAKDLALLRADMGGAAPVRLDSEGTPSVGTEVYSFGAPFGLEKTVTRGIVSAVRRVKTSFSAGIPLELVQTDAAISPGSSGGPLATAAGLVIGVCTAKRSDDLAEGLAFAIPSREIIESFGKHLALVGDQ
jgi:hypothetical protein